MEKVQLDSKESLPWTLKDRLQLAGILGAVAAITSAAVIFLPNSPEPTDHQVNVALRQDGFVGKSVGGGEIGDLVLGNCDFLDVTYDAVLKNGGWDIRNYDAPVGQTGEGKFQEPSVEIRFQNAAQLELELPNLRCTINPAS